MSADRNRLTGVQVEPAAVIASLERFREQASPREYVVVIDILWRWIDAERQRLERHRRRWTS